jgi:fructose-specific PTS system IIA-like component
VASEHASDIRLKNNRNGREANTKSVLSLVAADIRHGDPCTLLVAGPSAERDIERLRRFLADEFPACDEELPVVETGAGLERLIPRPLKTAGATVLRGVPVSPGTAVAPVRVYDRPTPPVPLTAADGPEAEAARFDAALADLTHILSTAASRAAGAEAGILRAHLAIAADPEFGAAVRESIAGGMSAGAAVLEAERHHCQVLRDSGSALLRERALDVRDVAGRLLESMYGAPDEAASALREASIVVAESLTPSQFLSFDRRLLKGLVLAEAGATSHTVILARAFGVPCVTGISISDSPISAGETVVLDAVRGFVIPSPGEAVRRYYDFEERREERRRSLLKPFLEAECVTADGRRVEVAANASIPEEAEAAFANGAEGIGLYRTEMLFMDREAPPSEEEQFEQYSRVVAAAQGRPVIFRTLDIGGDKGVAYLGLPAEDNPFLGYRAIRFYPDRREIVRSQMRALLRASALGRVRVMFPMVCCVEEVRDLKAWLSTVRDELTSEGVAAGDPEIGVMVETPAAALAIPSLAAEVSFFSIGTNDLAQYFLAVDRGNRNVAGLYSPLHPAFLRLLQIAVDEAHAAQRWIGMCGEMAGDESMAPLLVGLGLDEISLSGPGVPTMKAALSRLDSRSCRSLLEDAVGRADRAGVEETLRSYAGQAGDKGILAPDIIELDSDALTREEVIKQLVDNLYLAGRVTDPDAVEEAVWQREDVYSTGVGHGFAIPHCKSASVAANSVGILRLRNGVEWNSLDGEPVRIALMLAIRESDHAEEHLRIFARLARKVMHEDFRERLLTEQDKNELLRYLAGSLEL